MKDKIFIIYDRYLFGSLLFFSSGIALIHSALELISGHSLQMFYVKWLTRRDLQLSLPIVFLYIICYELPILCLHIRSRRSIVNSKFKLIALLLLASSSAIYFPNIAGSDLNIFYQEMLFLALLQILAFVYVAYHHYYQNQTIKQTKTRSLDKAKIIDDV